MFAVTAGPDWAEIVTAVCTGILSLGVIAAAVGAFLAWNSVREDAKGRHAQIAVEMGRRWDGRELASSRALLRRLGEPVDPTVMRLYYECKRSSNALELVKLQRLANFFEDLGVLYELDILSLEWVDKTLGGSVTGYWSMWKEIAVRGRNLNAKLYENWELLADALTARRNGGP